jgi:hypothetical protein
MFQYLEYVIDRPVIFAFLVGKGGCVQEKEQGRGKIQQQGDDKPELFGVIYKHDRWVLDLFVEEQDAINNEQNGLHGSAQGIEILRFSCEKVDKGDQIEYDTTCYGEIFHFTLKVSVEERGEDREFNDGKTAIDIVLRDPFKQETKGNLCNQGKETI